MTEVPVFLYDTVPYKLITMTPDTTIGQLKQTLQPFLQQFPNYGIKFVYGNKNELSPVVFTTNTYDGVNFQRSAAILPGSNIYLIDTRPFVFILTNEGNFEYASLSIEKVLRYWLENYIEETGYVEVDTYLTEIAGIDEVFDFNKKSHQNDILDAMAEAHFDFFSGRLD